MSASFRGKLHKRKNTNETKLLIGFVFQLFESERYDLSCAKVGGGDGGGGGGDDDDGDHYSLNGGDVVLTVV